MFYIVGNISFVTIVNLEAVHMSRASPANRAD